MKFNRYIKLILLTIGVGIMVYISIKLLIYKTTKSKFDINNYANINYFLYTEPRKPYFTYNELPKTDYNRLINISFEFKVINYVCNNTNPLLLILVPSSATNFAERETIRDTWGRSEEAVKVLFLLGSTLSQELKQKLINENNIHRDIIQGSFLESYVNLTYKHIMAFKYVVYHCPHTKYVLKTDDDVFVNVPLMKNFLTKDLSAFGASKLLMCTINYEPKPFRSYRSKWRVTFDEYPYKYYPSYCQGWFVLYSPDVIFDFYKEAQRMTYFWIDDVYIGMVADKIGFINHVDIFSLTLSKGEVRSIINYSQVSKPFLFGHADMKESEIRSLWEYVVNNPVHKSIRETVNNKTELTPF